MLMTTVLLQLFAFVLLSSQLLNAVVCIIKSFPGHDIKQVMSYHIMEFYITTIAVSSLFCDPMNSRRLLYCFQSDHDDQTN